MLSANPFSILDGISIRVPRGNPTRIRETGVGLFEGCGRFFGGVLAPFIMSFILTTGGVFGSYIFVAVVALGGVAVVALLGTETRGMTIDQASEDTGALQK